MINTPANRPDGKPVSWPQWRREAVAGVRVQHVDTGWTGTVVSRGVRHVSVKWDRSGSVGRIVAPAYDLKVVA